MNTHRFPAAALVLLLAGSLASAQPAADPAAKAKEHYEKAVRLYEVGKYDQAITEFQSAYELTGDAILIYNIAQAHKARGDFRTAIAFYKRYLGKDPNGSKKAEAEKKIAELEAELAKGTAPTPPVTGPGPTGPGTGPTGPGPSGPETTEVTTDPQPNGPTGSDVSLGAGVEQGPKLIRIFAGGGAAISSVQATTSIDPPLLGTFLVGGSYGIPLGSMTLDVGAMGTLRWLPYDDLTGSQHITLIYGLTALGGIRYPVMEKLDLRGELGLGFGAWSGLDTGNPFTGGGTTMATAAIGTLLWRIAAGAEYYVTDNFLLGGSLAFGQSRPIDSAVSDVTSSITHFDLLILLGYAM